MVVYTCIDIKDLNLLVLCTFCKINQGNQDSSENQKNVIQGQRPDMENRHI